MRVHESRLVITCNGCGHDVVAVGGEAPSRAPAEDASAVAAPAASASAAAASAHGLLELDEDEVRGLTGVGMAVTVPPVDAPVEPPPTAATPESAPPVEAPSAPSAVSNERPTSVVPEPTAPEPPAVSRPILPRDAEVFSVPEAPTGGKRGLPLVLIGLGVVLAVVAVVTLRPSTKEGPVPVGAPAPAATPVPTAPAEASGPGAVRRAAARRGGYPGAAVSRRSDRQAGRGDGRGADAGPEGEGKPRRERHRDRE